MASKVIRVSEEDYNRLMEMRNIERKFIKDVITHLIEHYIGSEVTPS